jgi:Transglycosylase SLT domain
MAEIVKGLFNLGRGASSGMLDLGVGIPSLVGQAATGKSALEAARRATRLEGTRPDPRVDPVGAAIYDFGEGAVPAGALGLLGGPVTAGVAGVVGGAANVAAKRLFPENPLGQAAVNLIPMVASPSQGIRSLASRPTPASRGATGVTLTPGQATGEVKQLAREARLASTAEGQAAFRKTADANARVLKDYASTIQNIANNTRNASTDTIRNETVKAFNTYSTKLLNKFRAENRLNFDKAAAKAGDAELFSAQPVVDKLQELISLYSSDKMPAELQVIAKKMQGLVNKLTVPGTPASPGRLDTLTNTMVGATEGTPAVAKNFTIKELQRNLESWGKAAYGDGSKSPDRVLENVAKGTVQNISRDVLGAYRTVLDDAAQLNVPGAAELKAARDSFKNNLKSIEDVAVTPLFKKFGIDNPNAIRPDDAVKVLTKATPSERVVLMQVLEQKPEVLNAIRGRAFETVVNKSKGDISALRQGVKDIIDNKKSQSRDGVSDLEFLFPTKQEQTKLLDMFGDMEKLGRNATGQTIATKRAIEGERAAAEAGGVIAGAPARYAGNIFVRLYENFLQDPTKFIEAYNNPNYFKNLTNLDQKFIASGATDEKVGGFLANVLGTARGVAQEMPVKSAVAVGGLSTARDVTQEQEQNQELIVPEELQQLTIPEELEQDLVVPPDLQSATDFEQMIRAEAERQGVGQYADQLVAMARAESSMNPNAKAQGSTASGLFQLTKAARQDMGVSDPFDPMQNIEGGVGYFKKQFDQFGSPQAAMAAFNQGPGAFSKQGFTPAAKSYLDLVNRNM